MGIEYIVTFGSGQPNEGCFIRVIAGSEEVVREYMRLHFDNKYAFIYPNEEAGGVEKWGLKEIK